MNKIIILVSKIKSTPPLIIAPPDQLPLIVAQELTAKVLLANLAAKQLAGARIRDVWINN
ncbi:MAG: hypothetical protein JJU00_04850 [Opitutales bacterium]|nr:hypothetical protein [Opitutales bacterium]